MSKITIDIMKSLANKPSVFELRGLGIKNINPCPFCQCESVHLIEDEIESWVRCNECGADGPPHPEFSGMARLGAIKKWHFRKS